MTQTVWIVLGISLVVILGFIAVLRAQLRQNREIEKHIDYSKLRPWNDDDENEEDK